MRDRVNVAIDHRIKQMFEDLKETIGKEWTEVVENAALQEIMRVDPVQALEYKLKVGDERQEMIRHSLARTKMNAAVLKERAAVDQPDPELERRRKQLFHKDKNFLLRLYKQGKLHLSLPQGGPNWAYLIQAGSYRDQEEAERDISKRIEEELSQEK